MSHGVVNIKIPLVCRIEFTHTKGEAPGLHSEGCDEEYYIDRVTVCGIDVTKALNDDTLEAIERQIKSAASRDYDGVG